MNRTTLIQSIVLCFGLFLLLDGAYILIYFSNSRIILRSFPTLFLVDARMPELEIDLSFLIISNLKLSNLQSKLTLSNHDIFSSSFITTFQVREIHLPSFLHFIFHLQPCQHPNDKRVWLYKQSERANEQSSLAWFIWNILTSVWGPWTWLWNADSISRCGEFVVDMFDLLSFFGLNVIHFSHHLVQNSHSMITGVQHNSLKCLGGSYFPFLPSAFHLCDFRPLLWEH